MTFITPTYPKEAILTAKAWAASHNMPAFAMVIEMQPNVLYHCKNCTDLGILYLKLPSKGPFASPILGKVVTWFDGNEAFGKGWYTVEQVLPYACPMCERIKGKA